jgi:hypothetical protein
MPIDPSIALNVKPVQIANPLEQYMQVQQIQQAQNQNRLADLMYANQQRDVDQAARLNDLYKTAVGDDGTLDRTKLYRSVASAGLGARLPALQKSLADADKVQADVAKAKSDTSKTDLETASHQFEIAGQLASAWAQNPNVTQQQIRSGLAAAASSKIISPEIYQAKIAELDAVPPDSKSLNQWALGTLQQVMKAKDSMGFIRPDANTVANNATSAANNAATNATTRRGQDLTDARARELNANSRGQYDAARGVLVDTRTGTATAVTGPDGKPLTRDKAMTEFQGKSAGFADRAQEADAILNQLHAKGPSGLGLVASDRPGTIKGIAESVPFIGEGLGGLVNTLPSAIGGPNANQQRAEQAQRNFVNAILRQESGAAIGAGEFENARKQYFPQPGDTPEVIAQKAANRRTAIAGLARSAGGNYTPPAPGAASATPSSNGLPAGWSVEVH